MQAENSKVVTDQGLSPAVTPETLDAFCDKLTGEIREGRHDSRAAA
jgi:protease I